MEPPAPLLLIVEDDPHIRARLQDVFTDEGYAVATADSATAAITQLAEGGVALVILDWFLVQTTALPVLRAARADPRTAGVPILVLTASARPADLEAIVAGGADACMAKPFDLEELLAWVRAHVAPPGRLQP